MGQEFTDLEKLPREAEVEGEAVVWLDESYGDGRLIARMPHTPECVSELALNILDVSEGERLVDFGCGMGAFLGVAARMTDGARLEGVEANEKTAFLGELHMGFLGSAAKVEAGDMFDYFEKRVGPGGADKAFSNYPWGPRANTLSGGSAYLASLLEETKRFGGSVSAEWVYNRLLVDSISEDGCAVGVMTNGAALNSRDARMREHFLRNGWVTAVISLPERLFAPQVHIATVLIVLGHGGGESVRVVDASDLGERGRRSTTLAEGDIQEIMRRLEVDTEHSATVSIDQLEDVDFSLLPSRLLGDVVEFEDAVPLGDLAVSVRRGAGLRASELDDLMRLDDTGSYYLKLSNIEDGMVDDELPSIALIDPKLERHCVLTGDLLVTKNGNPFKAAVAAVPDGCTILANGNLYIVRLDTNRVDPHYLAAFFNSEAGMQLLANASRGAAMPVLSLADLKGIQVPVPEMDEQRRVAEGFRSRVDELKGLKRRIAEVREEMRDEFSR